MSIFLNILGILVLLLIIMISVGLHEAGHMWAAKYFKLKVPKFAIGFGPTLFSKKTKNTEYAFKAIPLGGFVNIEDPNDSKDSFLTKINPIKRIIVFLAGPIMNIVLGFIILVSVFLVMPIYNTNNIISEVQECSESIVCGAEKAGLAPGDTILKIENVTVTSLDEMSLQLKDKESVQILVENNVGKELKTINVKENRMGILLEGVETKRTLAESFETTNYFIVENIKAMGRIPAQIPNTVSSIFGEERDEEGIASIVSVGQLYGKISSSTEYTVQEKLLQFVSYAGAINLGLGLFNLLPILPLDGGRIFFSLIDLIKMGYSKVFKKKYNPTTETIMTKFGMASTAVIFTFMILLIVADIVSPII